jgi:hypothetical protein
MPPRQGGSERQAKQQHQHHPKNEPELERQSVLNLRPYCNSRFLRTHMIENCFPENRETTP